MQSAPFMWVSVLWRKWEVGRETDLHIFELGAGLAEVIPRHIISFELKLLSIKLISLLSWLGA